MSENKKRLEALISHYKAQDESLNKSCQIIAARLNPPSWTWEYVKQIYLENKTPGKYLVRAIKRLHYQVFLKRDRHRVHVDAKDPKRKERWLSLAPEIRAAALDKAYEEQEL